MVKNKKFALLKDMVESMKATDSNACPRFLTQLASLTFDQDAEIGPSLLSKMHSLGMPVPSLLYNYLL